MLTEAQQQEARALVLRLAEELRRAGYPVLPIREVKFSHAQRQYGCCRLHRSGGSPDYAVITVGEICWHSEEGSLLSTCLHELIHAMPDTRGHGRKFLQYAEELGHRYGVAIHARATKSEWEAAKASGYVQYKYLVRCRKCQRVFPYMRRSRFVQDVERGSRKWRCKCGSRSFSIEYVGRAAGEAQAPK